MRKPAVQFPGCDPQLRGSGAGCVPGASSVPGDHAEPALPAQPGCLQQGEPTVSAAPRGLQGVAMEIMGGGIELMGGYLELVGRGSWVGP